MVSLVSIRQPPRVRRAAVIAALLVALSVVARAAGTSGDDVLSMPAPADYVTDKAEVIDADSASALNGLLGELERKTTVQFLVVTIDTTGGRPIADLARDLGNRWRLGQKGRDNGVLVLLALKDHDVRIAVGEGLGSTLTPSFCDSVASEEMAPFFKRRQYGEGLMKGTVSMLVKLEDLYEVKLYGMPKRDAAESTETEGDAPAEDETSASPSPQPSYAPPVRL